VSEILYTTDGRYPQLERLREMCLRHKEEMVDASLAGKTMREWETRCMSFLAELHAAILEEEK
jgi:hypothetical protein